MKRFGLVMTLAAVFAVSSCGPRADDQTEVETPTLTQSDVTVDTAVAPFLALAETSFVQTDANEADLSALVSALPDYAALTWDTKSFDAATGATVFTGLAIGFGEEAPFGIRFEKASVWGLETDLLTARLGGERLDERGALFTRLDGTQMSYFGVDAAFNTFIDSLLVRFDVDWPDEFELAIDSFEMTAQRVIVTDAALRPFELVEAPADLVATIDDAEAEEILLGAVHLGQHLIAVSRAMSYGNTAMFDTKGRFAMRQPGVHVDIDMSYDLYGYSGAVGFDLDQVVVQNSRTLQVSEYAEVEGELGEPSFTGFPAGTRIAQEETTALSTVQNIRLDKVMGFLARSELPGMDERDLMSLGRWQVRDYAAKLNDKQVFTAKSLNLHADKFEWLIPSDIGYELNQATINIEEVSLFFQLVFEGIMSTAEDEIEDEGDKAEFDLMMEGLAKSIELLPEHGLDSITFDASMNATWGADTGPVDVALSVAADGFGENVFDVALDMPVYSQLQSALEAEDKEAAFEAIFEEAFAFRGMRYFEKDKGGYDKILGFANAIGKAYPDQGWGAMLGNMEPPQMRTYLATMVRIGKTEAAREFPAAAEWLESYATYLETGGTFEVKLAPPVPITKTLIESYEDEPDPDEIVELLGITVTQAK